MDLDALLRVVYPDARLLAWEVLTGGVSAEVYGLRYAQGRDTDGVLVVRRHREREGKAPVRERASREYALLGALHTAGLPVPPPLGWVGPDTLLLGWRPGTTRLPPQAETRLGALLARIHRVSLDGLPPLAARESPIERLKCAFPGSLAIQEALVGFAARRERSDSSPCLLHGDLWPGNVLWREGEVSAILDWEDAAVGDPLSDVACARVELACAGADPDAFTRAWLRESAAEGEGDPLLDLSVWDLYVSTAALDGMELWGLEAAVLAERKARTRAFQDEARARLGG